MLEVRCEDDYRERSVTAGNRRMCSLETSRIYEVVGTNEEGRKYLREDFFEQNGIMFSPRAYG